MHLPRGVQWAIWKRLSPSFRTQPYPRRHHVRAGLAHTPTARARCNSAERAWRWTGASGIPAQKHAAPRAICPRLVRRRELRDVGGDVEHWLRDGVRVIASHQPLGGLLWTRASRSQEIAENVDLRRRLIDGDIERGRPGYMGCRHARPIQRLVGAAGPCREDARARRGDVDLGAKVAVAGEGVISVVVAG